MTCILVLLPPKSILWLDIQIINQPGDEYCEFTEVIKTSKLTYELEANFRVSRKVRHFVENQEIPHIVSVSDVCKNEIIQKSTRFCCNDS